MPADILWYLSIAAKGVAATVLLSRGYHLRYPALVTFLAFATGKSLILVAVRLAWGGSSNQYMVAWIAAQALAAWLLIMCGVEAFRRVTEHYVRFHWYATGIVTGAGIFGAAAAVLMRYTPTANWIGYIAPMVAAQKWTIGILWVMLAFSLLFVPRFSTVAVRPSADRNALCLLGYIAGEFASVALMQSRDTYHLGGAVGVISAGLAAIAWTLLLTPNADLVPPVEHVSDESLRRSEERLRGYFREFIC